MGGSIVENRLHKQGLPRLSSPHQRASVMQQLVREIASDLDHQEVVFGQALEQLFDSDEWSILIYGDSNDAQDLAIVVKRPLKFKDRTGLDAGRSRLSFPGSDI
jgi:hypothetical protein